MQSSFDIIIPIFIAYNAGPPVSVLGTVIAYALLFLASEALCKTNWYSLTSLLKRETVQILFSSIQTIVLFL